MHNNQIIFFTTALVLAGLLFWLMPPVNILYGLLAAIILLTILIYRYDKSIAGGNRWRIPERALLALALFGGSPGAIIAMYVFSSRHKAQKPGFYIPFWIIVVIQLAILFGYRFYL